MRTPRTIAHRYTLGGRPSPAAFPRLMLHMGSRLVSASPRSNSASSRALCRSHAPRPTLRRVGVRRAAHMVGGASAASGKRPSSARVLRTTPGPRPCATGGKLLSDGAHQVRSRPPFTGLREGPSLVARSSGESEYGTPSPSFGFDRVSCFCTWVILWPAPNSGRCVTNGAQAVSSVVAGADETKGSHL